MKDRVAVITGALSGIGRATAVEFARRGATVVVSGRNPEAGAALVAELEGLGTKASFFRADMCNEAEIAGLIDHAVATFDRIDFAINNAGTEGQSLPLVDQTADSYAEMFDINVRGTLPSMKYEMAAMAKTGGGGIVNLSSTMARVARPGLGVYCASKAAVEALTRVGAVEGAANGIRVNAIAPGAIDTPMLDRVAAPRGGKQHVASTIPMRRTGTPEEAAQLIVFLASDAASYVTGQCVAIEGGRLAC